MYFFLSFIREFINYPLSSRMVPFLSLGQSIVCIFIFQLYRIKFCSGKIQCCLFLFYIMFRKPYRQHLNLPNYMQLHLKSFKYSSRKMKVLIYKILNFKNLVSFHLSLLIISKSHIKLYHGLLLLLLLSRFSRVRLCATPQTAAQQAPPSLGFSSQEHWSGLPFPSPMHENEK